MKKGSQERSNPDKMKIIVTGRKSGGENVLTVQYTRTVGISSKFIKIITIEKTPCVMTYNILLIMSLCSGEKSRMERFKQIEQFRKQYLLSCFL